MLSCNLGVKRLTIGTMIIERAIAVTPNIGAF